MKKYGLTGASVLTLSVMLGVSSAIADPPDGKGRSNLDLLNCDQILDLSNIDNTCQSALYWLCYDTVGATANNLEEGFKKQIDQDSLVTKVVGAAIKYDEGKDDQGHEKLWDYQAKIDGFACFSSKPGVGDAKPKIQCDLQGILSGLVINALEACWAP